MSYLSCLNFFYRSTSETLGFEWGMRDRTWHQGMLFRFIIPLRRHHRDFRVGVGHEG